MGEIKLVITDLDGTFLDSPGVANKLNVEAVQACTEAGIPVCVATARSYLRASKALTLGGFTSYCVACNGAALYNIGTGEVLYRKTIRNDSVRRILEVCAKTNTAVHVAARGIDFSCAELEDPFFIRSMPSEWVRERELLETHTETLDELVCKLQDDTELLCVHAKDRINGFDESFYRLIFEQGEFSMTSSGSNALDIMAHGVSKIMGAQYIADLMSIKPEQVMACGDCDNDIELLQWAGIGVAMGDGQPCLQAVADFVSDDHDKGGVAKAIYKFVL